ncbi:MAG: type II toxin-antitoxin system MqsR family toxin [Nitrospinae bacterium]|nr:type II toxin-antitoxin system MqsR family toxin [Nitrospinota bacterium]
MYKPNRDDESPMTLPAEDHGPLGLSGSRREETPAVDVSVECEMCGKSGEWQKVLKCLECCIARCDVCLVVGSCSTCNERKKRDVEMFLEEFKSLRFRYYERPKYKNELTNLGLTSKDVTREILSLSVADYSKGPESDRDMPGYIWEFGKTVVGKEFYIKLKIDERFARKIALCFSFHPERRRMEFPFSSREGGVEK